jgi:hypothetical protein
MRAYLAATAAAVAVRNACRRQIDQGRSIDNINLDAIVTQAVRDAVASLPCQDDVFERLAQTLQAQFQCLAGEAFEQVLHMADPSRGFGFSPWRHGGWYVGGVRYPSGACGCVSSNYPDRKWRIVCDRRRGDLNAPGDVTFRTRDEAALAERLLALEAWVEAVSGTA